MTNIAPDVTAAELGVNAEPSDDADQFQKVDVIAELGWQAHIAWERIIGEQPQPDWSLLSPGGKTAIIESVDWLVNHPTSSVAAQHDAWRAHKSGAGWQFGEERDIVKKSHPNMVTFDDLPFSQQMKARLWRHIIFAVLG